MKANLPVRTKGLMFSTNVLMFQNIRTSVKNIRTFVLSIKIHGLFGVMPHFGTKKSVEDKGSSIKNTIDTLE